MAPSRSYLVTWQCWISLFRLLSALYLIGWLGWMLNNILRDLQANPHLDSSANAQRRWWVAQDILCCAFWIIVFLNDMFILTIDIRRTSTYLGCITAQAVANFAFTALLIGYLALNMIAWKVYSVAVEKIVDIMAVTSVFLGGTCSLGLLVINLSPFFTLRSHVSLGQLRRTNTKDAFRGSVAPLAFCVLSLIGHQRDTSIKNPVISGTKKFLGHLFLRRVRPVETRVYAFFRNIFAVIAIVVLTFRMVTALQKAQNEISTRMTSSACDLFPEPNNHNINLVLERSSDSFFGEGDPPNITVTISYRESLGMCVQVEAVLPELKPTFSFRDSRNCSVIASKELGYARTLDTFVCPSPMQMSANTYGTPQVGVPFYRLGIKVSRNNGSLALQRDIPSIWLSNGLEQPGNLSLPHAHPVRAYMPAWVLRPGYHMDAEAKLITRRLIRSSIMKDVILNSKPAYTSVSLYPIADSGLFSYSNASIATGEMRVTLRPGFMYFGARAIPQNLDYPSTQLEECDYIDDYRSSTILDVIGSVGGLFAVLHGIHVLLFGRPLLWGIAGTKLITPFGILGMCSSRRFKERLKEQYHHRSTEGNVENIHIVSFLRDFVIDFGPADLDLDGRPSRRSISSPLSTSKEEGIDGAYSTRIPLMRRDTDSTHLRQRDKDADSDPDWSSASINGAV
ncbi:unnamed protein product [Rhizoctonia solani]|uniref:Transmembrane protein n=1 Tax=Rhizoctonia solani TaxID=456999 RepID=A0A8H3HY22_9AGAM|nr:unnamed protein product [Rhizoctonia solani]